jgi:hypothetical protein
MFQKEGGGIRLWALCALCFLMVGCGGGGGSSASGGGGGETDVSVLIDWQQDAVDGTGQVVLPETSPVELGEIQVDVYDFSASPDSSGEMGLKLPENQIVDAYIMLPERAEDTLPTIFLYTTVLPGETTVQFSAQETAVSLLMGRINQDLLVAAGTPAQVRQMIREQGAGFIDEFVAAQANNPYLLNPREHDVLYTAQFETSADSCRDTLLAAAAAQASLTQAVKPMAVSGSQLYVRPEQTQHDFTVYEDTTGLLGIGSWLDLEDAGGMMTGQLKIENDTMLFAHFVISDLLTGSEIKSLTFDASIHGYIAAAFHPDLLGPQKGWNRLWWAGTSKTDVEYKSTKVVLYTPNIVVSDVATELEKVIGGGLAFRTGATALMSVVSNFVPLDEDGWKHWFVEMYDRGLLTAALDKFAYGDIKGGVEALFWTFSDVTVMESFIKDYLAKYIKNQLEAKKLTAQLLNKFNQVTKLIPIGKIGLAIDLAKLVDDVALIPGKITFDRAEFPFNLSDAAPSVINKVSPEAPLPIITITGMGLSPVLFGGETYLPSVFLEAENLEGELITKVIDEEDISVSAGGESLWFELPRDWAEVGSNVVGPIYLTLPHEAHESLFALSLGTEVVITALSDSKPVRGQEITLFGQGFSTVASENRVYFTDHLGVSVAAQVDMATSTLLDVVVPESLALGPLTVEVELVDESESNAYPLSLHPIGVQATPPDGTHFDETLQVALAHEDNLDIYYSLGSGDETAYSGVIELTDTTHIYPFARITVNGVDYDSVKGNFFYYKCAANETLVEGVCVDSTPANQIWKLIESVPYIECDNNYTNRSQEPGAWSISYTQSWGGYDVLLAQGSYTSIPTYLSPQTPVSFTVSVETSTSAEDGSGETYETQVWALTYNQYPLTDQGRIDFTQTASLNQVVVEAQSSGNGTDSQTGALTLPLQGWVGWANYVVLQTGGGTVKAIGGCDLRYNNVYLWQE